MPKYNCSYAYDISCFADFVVTAKNQAEAEKLIEAAFDEGRFMKVIAEPNVENFAGGERVFVSGRCRKGEADGQPTLDQLVAEAEK